MNSTTDDYNKKVWAFLERMKPGERHSIRTICREENRERFVEGIKSYMRSFPYDGWISFNHDFSEFYSTPPVPVEQLNNLK